MDAITSEHYAIDDDVISTLNLDPAVEVRIDIEETGVKLFIGPREYEWPRGCPDVCSVRTGSTARSMGRREKVCKLSRKVT